jgi:hypothetical protein
MDPLIPNVPVRPRFRSQPLVVCGLAATAVATVISCVSPPLYRSSARFEFLRDPAEVALPLFQQPEIVSKAGVRSSRLSIRAVPGSAQVEVTVLDENPKRAADLANSLASAYQAGRLQAEAATRPDRMAALEASTAAASAVFETAKQDYEAMSRTLAEARGRYGDAPDGPWRRQGEVDAALEHRTLLSTQLNELQQSKFPDFLQVANRHKLINSDRMVWVAEYLGTVTTLQAQSQAGLPDTHPDVLQTKQKASSLRVQLEKDAADLTASLALKIDALNQRLQSMERDRIAQQAVLREALASFEVAETVYRSAQAKLRQARIALETERAAAAAMPSYIAVVRPAEPKMRAAQPGFWLPLLLSPAIGLAGGLVFQTFRMPRTGRRQRPVTV